MTGESVLVHAHAQLFGFVLFFVIGIAGHAIPRISKRPLDHPWLLWVALAATLAGQIFFPIGVWSHQDRMIRGGEAMDLLAAAALGVTVWAATRFTPKGLGPWLRLGSLNLVLAAGWGLAGALDERLPLERSALWQLSLWGFIAPFIFGMSSHILDMAGGFEVRTGGEWLAALAWAIGLALGILGEVGQLPALPGALLELAVAVWLTWRLGLFRPLLRPRRGAPFFASAFTWLLIALLLNCLKAGGALPDHLLIDDAARHTFTIGCVTQMIVGVALRALPVAGGVPLAFPALSVVAYVLINGAVVLRLGRIVAATVSAEGLRVSGVSGFVALACLVCFAVCLAGTVRRVLPRSPPAPDLQSPL